ncbi:molybdenum cofactor guanylyltransferase [Neorhodopirellula lusitana]|uniref:molybdenum cofactor guanylyltransferase n=1 Tax=Neorhodopirellula lusitana TaxID=445327 RepID=UPI00384D9DD3
MANRSSCPLLGVVLAGGRSSRMGRCKALLTHTDGATFLHRAIEQVRPLSEVVACAIAQDQQDVAQIIPAYVTTLRDQCDQRGPAEGLLRALEFAASHACVGAFVIPVDVPALGTSELQLVQRSFECFPNEISCAVSDNSPDRLEPLIAIYPTGLLPSIAALAKSDNRSLYRFIQKHSHHRVPLPPHTLTNVNHPEDWNEPSPHDPKS